MNYGKKILCLLLAAASLCLILAGCSEEKTEPKSNPFTPLSADPAKVSAVDTVPFPDWLGEPEYDDRNAPVTDALSEAEIKKLNADPQPYGPGNTTVGPNRAIWADASQTLYGKYSADFYRETEEKRIYLTFDEGYENGFTSQILDILKEKNVKATFFITMPYAKTEEELVNRMIREGHTVGNHSVTHPSAGLPTLSMEKQKNEVMELHNYVKEKYGYEMYLFRYPEGIYSVQSMALIQSLGYRTVFWTFAHNDWNPDNQPEEQATLDALKDKLCPGEIILLHAVSETNTNILARFIDMAREEGFSFAEVYPRS